MNIKTVEFKIMALENAAEFIKSHAECGWTDEDFQQAGIDPDDEKEYTKACNSAFKMINKQAGRLRNKYKL